MAGLTRESEGDIRAKPEYDREEFEDDRRKNNTVIAGLDPTIKERDVRLKAEHDIEKKVEHDKEKAPQMRGLIKGFLNVSERIQNLFIRLFPQVKEVKEYRRYIN